MLRIENVEIKYGNIAAVRNVSLEVNDGEVVVVLGANGAGKTTLLKGVIGLVKISRGQIYFEGKEIQTLPTESRVALGLTLVPEGRRVFPRLTVRQNLELGAFVRNDRNGVKDDIEAYLRKFNVLKERQAVPAQALSGGEQQILALCRALVSKPKLLMLDEPSMGLAPVMVKNIYEILRDLKRTRLTMLLVEQNVKHALTIADRVYVMQSGAVAFHGDPTILQENPELYTAYLG